MLAYHVRQGEWGLTMPQGNNDLESRQKPLQACLNIIINGHVLSFVLHTPGR